MITRYFMHAGNTSDENIENLSQTYFSSWKSKEFLELSMQQDDYLL